MSQRDCYHLTRSQNLVHWRFQMGCQWTLVGYHRWASCVGCRSGDHGARIQVVPAVSVAKDHRCETCADRCLIAASVSIQQNIYFLREQRRFRTGNIPPDTMRQLGNRTNSNRTGIFSYRIHQGAPTKDSTQALTTATAKCGS